MLRAPPRCFAVALTALGLAACGDTSQPTQPDPEAGGPVPAPAFAVAVNSWTPKAALPTGAVALDAVEVTIAPGHSLVYALGGKVMGLDHDDNSPAIHAYDLATNTWTQKQVMSGAPSNTNGVGKIGALLYFSGGNFNAGMDPPLILGHLYVYNPFTDVLTRKADMPLNTGDGVTGVMNRMLYVLPGTCNGDFGGCALAPIRTFYRYDPVTDTWATRRSCPHFHQRAGGGVINGKFYVVGGSTGGDGGVATATLDVYDPVTNTWITRAPMPAAASFVKATVLQNKLFVVTSTNGVQGPKAYSYDPVTNTWKTRAAPPTAGALARIQLDGHAHVLSVGGPGLFDTPPAASQLYTP